MYGIYIYNDDDKSGLKTLLGDLPDDDDEYTEVDDIESFASHHGLEITYQYSFDWTGYIIRAHKTYSASEEVTTIPQTLPDIPKREHEELVAIGKKLGKEPSWLLVAFYG